MITDEDKERVRQATDFMALVSETVELRRRGADWWGCCPFHHEKSPSFHINPSTGLWKCFGCGLGGDVFGYVMHRENLEFPDAIRYLADRAGIELVEERGARRGPKRNRLIECLEEAQAYYVTMLNRGRGSGPADGRSYLAGRGFGSEVCRRWDLGYAPGHAMLVQHLLGKGFTRQEIEAADLGVMRGGRLADRFYERVMFPIHDEQGRAIGFGGRVLGDAKPKYLNTKETPVFHKGKHLFAFDKAKEHIAARGQAIVCEGYTDVIAMHEAGFGMAVAALGTSFSLDHVRTLARFARTIVCLFDGDAAGQRAAERAIQFLDKSEADLRCVVLPHGQDPAEFLDSHRPQDLEAQLAAAEPLMDFVLRKRLADVGPTSAAGVRAAKLDEVAGVLAPLKDSLFLDEYALEVANALGITADQVRQAVRNKPVRTDAPQDRRRTQARPQAAPDARAAGYAPDAPYADEGYAPYDYLPAEAYGPEAPAGPSAGEGPHGGQGLGTAGALNDDERVQVQAERELLSLLAADTDALRGAAERIATLSWVDERNETMAWAMLSTPEGTPASEVVRMATGVVPEAPQILASGRVASADGMAEAQKAAFVLDTVELYSTRRKIRALKARLRAGGETSGDAFREATDLQRHANDLAARIAAVR